MPRTAQSIMEVPHTSIEAATAASLADMCRAWLRCTLDGIFVLSLSGRVEHINAAGLALLQSQDGAALMGRTWASFWPAAERAKLNQALALAGAGETARFQGCAKIERGTPLWLDVTVTAIANSKLPQGAHAGFLVLFRDITAMKAAENLAAQSRRLESIGRLTGGIAHDFNNLLTVVMSASESLAEEACTDAERRALANTNLEAAERGADLVRRLMSFSRPKPSEVHTLDCARIVEDLAPLIRRTIGERITLKTRIDAAPLLCRADKTGLEAALLNLCLNSRDAMPNGGVIELIAEHVTLTPDRAAALGLAPGGYAVVSVRDNGLGMSQAVLDRAIEPFFTTKTETGGSGFGLSGTHGFTVQFGGRLTIESKPRAGSTVRLHLPLTDAAAQAELALKAPARSSDDLHVLLVEDDDQVRAETARLLSGLGHQVTMVADAETALDHLQGGDFDLMVTDMTLPGLMDGRRLAAAAKQSCPDLKVLLISGYLDAAASDAEPRAPFLAKPFRRHDLNKAIAKTISLYEPGRAPRRAKRSPR